MVGLILRESESTSALIEQLLTLARADADTEHLKCEGFNLRALMEEIDAGSRTLAETRGVHWTKESLEQPVAILADRANLRRLLLILIENACRYTETGGSVRLRLSIKGEEVVIEVSDAGIGIPSAELTNVFERFYRASNARFYDADGTGLGLPIARWIATAHGRTLTAQSTLGSGTCMSLRVRKNLHQSFAANYP